VRLHRRDVLICSAAIDRDEMLTVQVPTSLWQSKGLEMSSLRLLYEFECFASLSHVGRYALCAALNAHVTMTHEGIFTVQLRGADSTGPCLG
jgi:hypothetical protein